MSVEFLTLPMNHVDSAPDDGTEARIGECFRFGTGSIWARTDADAGAWHVQPRVGDRIDTAAGVLELVRLEVDHVVWKRKIEPFFKEEPEPEDPPIVHGREDPGPDRKSSAPNPKELMGVNKIPLHLLPPAGTEAQALAHFEGAHKYGPQNWRESGVTVMTYISAIMRHLAAYRDGQDRDPKSGVPHLGSIMASCAILLDAERCGMLTDDRVPAPPSDTDVKAALDKIRNAFKPFGENE